MFPKNQRALKGCNVSDSGPNENGLPPKFAVKSLFYILHSSFKTYFNAYVFGKRLQTRRVDDQRPADEENQTRLQHQIDVPIPTFKVLLINVQKSQRLRKRKAEDWRKSVKLQQHGQVPLDGNSLSNGPCTDIGKRQTSYFDFFASDLLK